MNSYAKLTSTDRLILETYKSIIEGLSEFLGSGYELVLHSLEDVDHAAIKVMNGHYTGRSEGAPITDLAIQMLSEIKKSGSNHKNLIYMTRNKNGTPIRSATLPITGAKDQIIGLLCINFYTNIPLNSFLDSVFKVDNGHHEVEETFARSTDELILSAIDSARAEVLNNPNISASNKNKEIVISLYNRDIFNLKDSVSIVANSLRISKNTVYLHLRNISRTH